ncbi:MAG: peptidyl-prolyl cis-trans isomerase [Nitrospinota bacterium]|nr:peptidyl-prolyl cis-trans isomerase [Nitrospinota bacterium]
MLDSTICVAGHSNVARLIKSLAILSLLVSTGCNKVERPASIPDGKVVATVNGASIIAEEIGGFHQDAKSGSVQKQVEKLVEEELLAQKAVRLGLDKDPGYLKKLRMIEVNNKVFKRAELASLAIQSESSKISVTPEEMKKYYDENSAMFRNELHIGRLVFVDEKMAGGAHAKLKAGASFEEMAETNSKHMAMAGHGQKQIWDMGFLDWKKIPEKWRGEFFTLEAGGISSVMPAGTSWQIIKVIEKRENPISDFANLKGEIENLIREKKEKALYNALVEELKKGAKISIK